MRKKKRVILHEGQMDVIATYRAGLKEVICIMGVGINDSLVKIIKKEVSEVIICYDSDKAGIEASRKAIRLFRNNGFQIHLVLMQGAKDPDEYIKK
jgi:DNA primase